MAAEVVGEGEGEGEAAAEAGVEAVAMAVVAGWSKLRGWGCCRRGWGKRPAETLAHNTDLQRAARAWLASLVINECATTNTIQAGP